MKLYDIPIEFQRLQDLLEESCGELTPEVESHWKSLQANSADKIDAAACVLRGLKSSGDALAEEIGRLQMRKDAVEKSQERLRALMLPAVDALGGKVKTDRFTIFMTRRKNYAMEIKPGCELWELDSRFYRVREPELAKTEIRKHLEAGGECPQALSVSTFETQSLTVR